MATYRAVQSLRTTFLALFFVASLTTACKKSGGADDVDPRDQYVGTYTGTYRNTIYIVEDIFGEPKSGTSTITVTKGSNPKEIYVEVVTVGDRAGDKTLKVTAELDGANYTVIDKNTDSIPIGNPVSSDYTASGAFDPNTKQASYTSVARGMRNGALYRQTYDVVGTKK